MVKLKTYNCIVFTDFQHTKFQNLSLGFILKIFLKFRTFQPRYSYKIYILIKKECITLYNKCVKFELYSLISHFQCCCVFH